MKKIICLFLFAIATISIANATGAAKKITAPSASLQKMWIDYDAKEGSRSGMMMHISFTAYDLKGANLYLGGYFKYNDDKPDSYLQETGIYDGYHTKEGTLATGKDINPTYDASVYEDVQIFMPYDVFNMDAGTYDLAISVQLLYKTGVIIAWLKMYEIEFTVNEKSRGPGKVNAVVKTHPAPTTGPRAVFDTLWVDFDVTENDQLGMRIHFKFTAYDMKDMEAYVAVYFEHNDAQGDVLKDKNDKFASSAGDVAVYKSINPPYTTAIYDDLQVFMPYSELELSAGTYELLMETKLIYKQGGLISNFVYQAFRYTEPK